MRHTQKISAIALLAAFAFLANYLTRFTPPIFAFPPLRLDAKDVIIVLGGFSLGVIPAMAIAATTAVLELSVSATGLMGLPMNIIASWAFAIPAVMLFRGFYNFDKSKNKLALTAISLFFATITMTGVMILWNWLLTPLIVGMPRQAVIPLLTTVFLPFNLIKGTVSSVMIMIAVPTLLTALRRAGIYKPKKPKNHIKNPCKTHKNMV